MKKKLVSLLILSCIGLGACNPGETHYADTLRTEKTSVTGKLENHQDVIVDSEGKRSFPTVSRQQAMDFEWEQIEQEFKNEGLSIPQRPEVFLLEDLSGRPEEEIAGKENACLHSKGWTNYYQDENGISASFPSRVDAVTSRVAFYECYYSYNNGEEKAYDEANVEKLWDLIVSEEIPCIEGKGYSVSGFPTKKTFVDSYFATQSLPEVLSYTNIPREKWHVLNECSELENGLQ